MAGLFEELKRRNVVRVGIAYLVAAWLVLQVIDVVLENLPVPPWVMQVILLLTALGFPLAIVFAWAFELTPEGLKRERDVDRSESITPQTGRKLDRPQAGSPDYCGTHRCRRRIANGPVLAARERPAGTDRTSRNE
jgi:hypothetical protein